MLMGKIFTFSGTDCTTPGFIVPAGKAFIITEATFFMSSSSPPSEGDLLLETGTGGTCTAFIGAAATTTAGEALSQSYPTGIVLPTGTELNLVKSVGGNGSVFVYRYLVPAGVASVQQGKGLPRVGGHSGLLAHPSGS